MAIQIIFRDEFIVAVNKPQALLSVPGLGLPDIEAAATDP
jgi:23S rRNA-/tRNA-specific pseudouridylate synthase